MLYLIRQFLELFIGLAETDFEFLFLYLHGLRMLRNNALLNQVFLAKHIVSANDVPSGPYTLSIFFLLYVWIGSELLPALVRV